MRRRPVSSVRETVISVWGAFIGAYVWLTDRSLGICKQGGKKVPQGSLDLVYYEYDPKPMTTHQDRRTDHVLLQNFKKRA